RFLIALKRNDVYYAEQALFFFERSKAAVLLEELMAQEAEGRSAVPPEVRSIGQNLEIEISYYRKLIDTEQARSQSANHSKISQWNSQLLQLTQEQEAWQNNLIDQYPEYESYLRPAKPNLQQIKTALKEHEAVISYFAGQHKWYCLYIDTKEVAFRQIEQTETIISLETELLANLKMTGVNGIATYLETAYDLFKLLIPSGLLTSDLAHLIVIPDGQLAFLPFDLLLTDDKTDTDIRSFPFLCKQLSVSYAYSWGVQNRKYTAEDFQNDFLYVAPVFAADKNRYLPLSKTPLPSTEYWDITRLLERTATKHNFMQMGQKYSLLHFASHASASDSILNEPTIEFIDSSLYLRDLQSMRLSAHLVVLSACDAGLGSVERGEGIMSLARGFTYAGVSSVVSTLWKINEQTTYQLLDRFYYYLVQGKSKDQALRLAKLDFLQNCSDVQAAPYYWAGIVVIGDVQAIRKKGWSRYFLMTGGFILFILLLVFKKNPLS
ncbi:MAG: CHAT domain-containing protein, partial [Bacteroidota bacterium]